MHSLVQMAVVTLMKLLYSGNIRTAMMPRVRILVIAVLVSIGHLAAQGPTPVETATLGPRVGAPVPAFSGVDQFGKVRTLASVYGPKGAMLVFFRSADW